MLALLVRDAIASATNNSGQQVGDFCSIRKTRVCVTNPKACGIGVDLGSGLDLDLLWPQGGVCEGSTVRHFVFISSRLRSKASVPGVTLNVWNRVSFLAKIQAPPTSQVLRAVPMIGVRRFQHEESEFYQVARRLHVVLSYVTGWCK